MPPPNVSWLLVIIFTLLLGIDAHKCNHPIKETSFPPKVPHLFLDATYLDRFNEVVVIGDVHGCLSELQLLLANNNIAGDNVLKILTGDILRKGPDSIGVIRFLRETPFILTVRGNNDQKVLERYLKHQNIKGYQYKKPDQFIKNMTTDDLNFIAELPYTISMPSLNAIVVHGGLIPGVPLEDHTPYDLMNMRNCIEDKHCPGGYRPFNGDKKGSRWAALWDGPQYIYFGHDHPRNLQITPKAIGVDTSCVYGRYLTGIFVKGPRKGKFVRQDALKQYFSH
ncbi:bis(5'-nucleosyl)-tetraphosphatase PrpE [asymmetrical]-like [Parasteatoda tepidariorum]|uniref:bis(5'-nucleosyl)-tetraphosphatase PrpE [asymmetrical]-like n=1 Tax=Parasteatoda tepidariorum TaxID=114398 RepID=UPI00077FCFF9|nr:bis(5'-nucleosyl)-tetraphosphatase PrpE [asymmetrical]-like [Parasteatoda tepidariorum]